MIRITYDPSAPVTAVNLPGSKSVAARAYVLNAIFNGWFMLTNIPDCDDTSDLGFALFKGEEEYDNPDAVYNLGSGATSLRFFLAYMASQPLFNGIIDCSPSLRRRPLAPLVDALRQAGADIEYLEEEGRPPLRVRGRALNGDGVKLAPGVSSQFESAMMMASLIWDSPYVPQSAPGVSRPYVEMTARMIEEMRRMVDENDNGFTMLYKIETDWSAASYFYELALIRPGRRFTLPGLRPPGESLQGDSACVDIVGRLGVDSEFDGEGNLVICGDEARIRALAASAEAVVMDMRDTPDLVPALAAGLCMAGIRFRFEGVAHLRFKECDRSAALVAELAKAGFVLEAGDSTLAWSGLRCEAQSEPAYASHGDHRMVMALAMTAAALGPVTIDDDEPVAKSFPDFFDKAGCVGLRSQEVRSSVSQQHSIDFGEYEC